MLFNSAEYLVLLAISVFAYWLIANHTFRLLVLLIASMVFYASWEPYLLLLLVGAILFNFWFALSSVLRTRLGLALIVFLNLAVLAYYKYTNFLLAAVGDLIQLVDGAFVSPNYSIALPIGISFFTFQMIGYVVDVRRGEVQAERSVIRFGVFISFFPQLIAGPICRANQFLPQLATPVTLSYARIAQGLLMIGTGLFLKVGIADNLSGYVDTVFDSTEPVAQSAALLATLGFGVQILCDFWGYSTMALGSAHLFGFSIPSNFDLPYIAQSLQSFWRRWHITLSFWLRDYLYISLGGNRSGSVRTYLNLIIVMVLGGLWHGASYNFIIWGLIHGLGLAAERLVTGYIAFEKSRFAIFRLGGALTRWLYTMFMVFLAWVFFRASDFSGAMHILMSISNFSDVWVLATKDYELIAFLGLFAVLMLPLHMLNEAGKNMNFYRHPEVPADRLPNPVAGRFAVADGALVLPSSAKIVLAFWLVCAGLILGSGESVPFIYFQF